MYARRIILKRAAAIPISVILADPMLARAVGAALETVTITTVDGKSISGALARPEKMPAPAIVLIHEWWGLNDQIKAVAADLSRHGYVALAIDLYDRKVATTRDDARSLMRAVDPDIATDTLKSWIAWVRAHEATINKLGTIGWCFGGAWSLAASIDAFVDATVVYYGNINRSAHELAKLKGPVLGHFATHDTWINEAMVNGFEAEMAKAGKTFITHWYEADHAFANPSSARYDEANAKLSWERTNAFLAKQLF